MTYTYTWHNPNQTIIKRVDEENNNLLFNAEEGNGLYDQLIESGATINDYVAPVATADSRTAAEKLEESTGLTVDELKTLLGL